MAGVVGMAARGERRPSRDVRRHLFVDRAVGKAAGTELHWVAESRLGQGIRLPRGLATPFMELDAGHSGRGGARFGVRHEFGERARGLVVEWGIEPSSFANAGNRILLEALGRC